MESVGPNEGAVVQKPSCQTCGSPARYDTFATTSHFVYAIGRLEPRFPSLGIEKELAQAIGRAGTARLTDREAMYEVLSKREVFYLVRQLCWVFTIQDIDAYVIAPRDSDDIRMLLAALRSAPRPGDVDVVVGSVGSLADGRACNGIRLPTIDLAQLYSFEVSELARHLRPPEGVSEESFAATVQQVMDMTRLLADNAGVRDDHRAVNYLTTRDPLLYTVVAKHFGNDQSLVSVRAVPVPSVGARRLADVVLEFRDRKTDVPRRIFARVDVTDAFPFLVSRWTDYPGHSS